MEPELLQRLRRMGAELEQMRARLAELHVLQHHLRARYGHRPPDARGPAQEPADAAVPLAVETGREEFLRAYA